MRAAATSLSRRRQHNQQLAGGHSGLAEVPYRCASAPEFHRTFPILAAGHDSRLREQFIRISSGYAMVGTMSTQGGGYVVR
jgi:hypothetical protein